MKSCRYVLLDPTGNLTCLVLDPVASSDRPEITRRLMAQCEQVAYLLPATVPQAWARIHLMGGEFCGNAAMASACFLADQKHHPPLEQRISVPIEMSGAEGIVICDALRHSEDWSGSVSMPAITSVFSFPLNGYPLTAVRMEGILHLVLPVSEPLSSAEAEALLTLATADPRLQAEEAIGLLQWDDSVHYMRPLVWVKESHTRVWETGCGSGSASIGAWMAFCQKKNVVDYPVRQPGGTIQVSAAWADDAVTSVRISGHVRLGSINRLTF